MDEFEMETTQEQEAADRLEQQRQQRREAAKRFRTRKAEEKTRRMQLAKEMKEDIIKAGVYDSLPDNSKAFIEELISGPMHSNTPMFNVVFGPSPKVGDSRTLSEIFNKTLKGKAAIDAYVKKWAEQGIVVEFFKNDWNILDSTYVVKKL